MGRSSAFWLIAFLCCAAAQDEWIESYDKASNKMFYYHSKTRESAWEAPAGAKIRYATESKGTAGSGEAKPGVSYWLVFFAFIIPIGLPVLGLLYCYYMASAEGLHDILKSIKAKRDRSAKRRATKARGRAYNHGTHKMSQDGKGGRSANS